MYWLKLYAVCVHSFVQIESDLGCPGGKARIIHKESDIITAFAINKVQLFYTDVTEQHSIQQLAFEHSGAFSN